MKAEARAAGADIIDLGMGNPDGMPAKHVIDKLAETAARPDVHRYSASKGIKGLRKAQAAYYKRRFDVDLDMDSEVVVTLGSKEGLANLAQAINRTRRCHPRSQSILSDPHFRVHYRGRSNPFDPCRARTGFLHPA